MQCTCPASMQNQIQSTTPSWFSQDRGTAMGRPSWAKYSYQGASGPLNTVCEPRKCTLSSST